jgi:hypothetical protein
MGEPIYITVVEHPLAAVRCRNLPPPWPRGGKRQRDVLPEVVAVKFDRAILQELSRHEAGDYRLPGRLWAVIARRLRHLGQS